MSKPVFVIKPDIFGAVFPLFLRRIIIFTLATVPCYYLYLYLDTVTILDIYQPALFWISFPLVFILAFISIKHRIIVLHSTKYLFYDSRIEKQFKLFIVRKQSLPLNHINRVINNSSIWNRMSNTGDILLRPSRSQEQDLVLHSIRNSDEVEAKIHLLMKNAPMEPTV